MATVDPGLRAAWQQHPDTEVELILHVSGELSALSVALAERGVSVRREFSLTRMVSVRCSGQAALGLANLPGVTRIEADHPVKALRR